MGSLRLAPLSRRAVGDSHRLGLRITACPETSVEAWQAVDRRRVHARAGRIGDGGGLPMPLIA
jgi:hypothetical protein